MITDQALQEAVELHHAEAIQSIKTHLASERNLHAPASGPKLSELVNAAVSWAFIAGLVEGAKNPLPKP